MVGVDVGGTHGSSLGRRGFRLAARVVGDYRSGSAGPRRPGLRRTGSRDPATPAAGIRFLWMILLLVCSPVAAQQSSRRSVALCGKFPGCSSWRAPPGAKRGT